MKNSITYVALGLYSLLSLAAVTYWLARTMRPKRAIN